MLTQAQIGTYEKEGYVTIDSPFTTEQLDHAEAAWDRLKANGGIPYEDPDYLEVIQHPYFEDIAKQILRSKAVHLWWGLHPHERAPASRPTPDPFKQWAHGCHVDIQASIDDFNATPRRMRAELWFWLNDVPAHRGAMRILPGSHRLIMEHWTQVLSDDHRAELPRVHGLRPPPLSKTAQTFPEHIPDVGNERWIDQQPKAATARRGQILVLCSAGLHSAWQNEDSVPRKAMGTSWIASGVRCGLPKPQRDELLAFFPEMRHRLRPDRRHIVTEHFDWLFESNYEPKWPETFYLAG